MLKIMVPIDGSPIPFRHTYEQIVVHLNLAIAQIVSAPSNRTVMRPHHQT